MFTGTVILGKDYHVVAISLRHYFHLFMDVGINGDQWDTKGNTRGDNRFLQKHKIQEEKF